MYRLGTNRGVVVPDEERVGSAAMATAAPAAPSSVRVTEEFTNVDQVLIHVTADRAEIVIRGLVESVSRRDRWRAPAGTLVPLASVIVTADFVHPRFGIPAAAWEAIFFVLTIASFVWLLLCLVDTARTRNRDRLIRDSLKSLAGGKE
jgi:hypothetical protein